MQTLLDKTYLLAMKNYKGSLKTPSFNGYAPSESGNALGPSTVCPSPPYDDGNEYAPSVFPSTADYAGPSKASWGIWWRLLQMWSTWAYGSCLSWNDENDDPSKQWRRKKTLQAIQEGKERITFLFALFSEQWHDYFVKNIYVL